MGTIRFEFALCRSTWAADSTYVIEYILCIHFVSA